MMEEMTHKSAYSRRGDEERAAEREAYHERKTKNKIKQMAKSEGNRSIWKNHPHINTLKKFAKANS